MDFMLYWLLGIAAGIVALVLATAFLFRFKQGNKLPRDFDFNYYKRIENR